MAKKYSDVFASIRYAKGEPRGKKHSSTDDEEHGAVGEIEWNQQLDHQKKRSMQEGLKDTCWKGYTAIGMKMKNGKKVPNCVPVKEENNPYVAVHAKKGKHETHGSTSYEAAQNAAKHWKMKNTSGISVYRADKTHSTQHVGEQFASDKPESGREAVGGKFTSSPAKTVTKPAPQATPKVSESKDEQEYDYEGDMAMSDLRSILHNAKEIHDMLEPKTNMPEWCQSKITLAEDYLSTVANYLRGEMNEDVEQIDEMPGANMDTRAVHKHLRKSGWALTRTKGGHDVYTHPKSQKHIAVPRHKQLKAPLVRGIMKDAQVSEEAEQVKESRGHKILATKLAQIEARKKRDQETAQRASEEMKKKEPVKEEKKGSWQKDTGWKKDKVDTVDKSGAKHSAMSRVKHLAKMAAKRNVTESENDVEKNNTPAKRTLGKSTEIVKNVIKSKKEKDEKNDTFQTEPELSSQIIRVNY